MAVLEGDTVDVVKNTIPPLSNLRTVSHKPHCTLLWGGATLTRSSRQHRTVIQLRLHGVPVVLSHIL